MNFRALPIISTVIVIAAVATMIALGIWQLGRADEKEALIARYNQSLSMSSEVRYPVDGKPYRDLLFRRSRLDCENVLGFDAKAGTNEQGVKGWAIYARCQAAGTDLGTDVVIGWSRRPTTPEWDGGEVRGMIAPGPRLIAMPPQAGLEGLALPDPKDLPNNHLAYAGQWFFFALTALVIYLLAIRKRLSGRREGED